MKELQHTQKEFDETFWQHKSPELVKARHILLHLMKTTGKLAAYIERLEHGESVSRDAVDNEIIPDLLFHALQLSNLYSLNLEAQYEARLEELRKRFSK